MSLSTKPYLLRALYEWCVDSAQTPHLVAWVNPHTRVPMQYVQDEQIVLNIGPNACHGLVIDNDWVHFSARFAGVAQDIWIPVGHVLGLFARESGEGMGFELEPYAPASGAAALAPEAAEDDRKAEAPPPRPVGKTGLKLVK